MLNPFLHIKRTLTLYSTPWIIVIILHSSLLYTNLQLELVYAVSDALVFNVVFGIMGIGLWYLVQYSTITEKHIFNLILNHVAIAIIFILCWYAISVLLLTFFFNTSVEYIDFIKSTFTWRIAFGVIIYIALLLGFYSFKINYSLKENELQQAQLQNYLREAELRSLKTQLNPHFIFNSLNSINALTVIEPEKARDMVVKLSEFLRYTLKREGETELAKLSEELENARRYLDIEKVRFGKNLVYEEDISERCLNIPVPNYMLQPLLENAIKHGVYDSLEPVLIRLRCEAKEEYLALSLSNSIEKENRKPSKGEGIGLRNIKNRLRLIYGKENLMYIHERDGQFIVNISIPKTTKS